MKGLERYIDHHYLEEHFRLWHAGQQTLGLNAAIEPDFEELKRLLLSNNEASLILDEFQSFSNEGFPDSPTATDIIFTYFDKLATSAIATNMYH